MNQLQTVLDALENTPLDYHSDSQCEMHIEAIAIVKQMMQAEPVAWLKMRYEGGHENLETTFKGASESFPVFAAPQAVPAEPSCPDCHAPHLLYECVHCSASNYPAATVVKESDMEPHDQNWIHGEDV